MRHHYIETKESDRVYITDYGIPTIHLGDGSIIISGLSFDHNAFAGIGFSFGEGPVGRIHDELKGKSATDIGVFFQIISDNPDSIQVLINRLTEAKKNLVKTNP